MGGREHVDQIKREMAERDAEMLDRMEEGKPRPPLSSWRLEHRDRLVMAAHVEVDELSAVGTRVLDWLAGWDNFTVVGVSELLAKAYDAGRASTAP